MNMNMSIRCEVTECRYNEGNEKYCTLDHIDIVKHTTQSVQSCDATDCGSFEPK